MFYTIAGQQIKECPEDAQDASQIDLEFECSFYLPISAAAANRFVKHHPRVFNRQMLIFYHGDVRKLVSNGQVLIQKKTVNFKKKNLFYHKKHVIQIEYKEAVEESLPYQLLETYPDSVITRHFFMEGNLRWSLNQRGVNWRLECECENVKTAEFMTLIAASQHIHLVDACFDQHPTPLNIVLKNSFTANRPFKYPSKNSSNDCSKDSPKDGSSDCQSEISFYAPKLDGVKSSAIVRGREIIIFPKNVIIRLDEILLERQSIYAQVEFVGGKYYIIDLCCVFSSFGVYTEIGILEAIELMQQFQKLGAITNTFFKQLSDVPTGPIFDGHLGFTADAIIKFKNDNTVDLIYNPPKKKKKIEECVSFGSGETIASLGYTIDDVNLKIQQSFAILECSLKGSHFNVLKRRADKAVANSYSVFKDMQK